MQSCGLEIGEANANASRLRRVLNHFSWAKQRFDSTADPVAKVALMLVPIATLLAFIATEERHQSADRDRATIADHTMHSAMSTFDLFFAQTLIPFFSQDVGIALRLVCSIFSITMAKEHRAGASAYV